MCTAWSGAVRGDPQRPDEWPEVGIRLRRHVEGRPTVLGSVRVCRFQPCGIRADLQFCLAFVLVRGLGGAVCKSVARASKVRILHLPPVFEAPPPVQCREGCSPSGGRRHDCAPVGHARGALRPAAPGAGGVHALTTIARGHYRSWGRGGHARASWAKDGRGGRCFAAPASRCGRRPKRHLVRSLSARRGSGRRASLASACEGAVACRRRAHRRGPACGRELVPDLDGRSRA